MITSFPAPATLPSNAAKEGGGNIEKLTQMIEIELQVLAQLRAMNIQLAALTGVTVNPEELAQDTAAGSLN
jgi:hypothetical protein